MDQRPNPQQIWNRIPAEVKQKVVNLALQYPYRSPQQIVWLFTDEKGYYISESSTYCPGELESQIACFVDYYNRQRYDESLDNLTPADVYFGRTKEVLDKRAQIKKQTMQHRRLHNLPTPAV